MTLHFPNSDKLSNSYFYLTSTSDILTFTDGQSPQTQFCHTRSATVNIIRVLHTIYTEQCFIRVLANYKSSDWKIFTVTRVKRTAMHIDNRNQFRLAQMTDNVEHNEIHKHISMISIEWSTVWLYQNQSRNRIFEKIIYRIVSSFHLCIYS